MDELDIFSSAEEKNKIEKGTLYLVATPIGNLADISYRALKVLAGVDFVAAEDTRNSGRLLSAFSIEKPLVSYHEHNKRQAGERIAERLKSGESCALITDAGTPAISDPGNDLCVLCAQQGIPVTAVPGACAVIDALALSALPTVRFAFEGFLPSAGKERRERIEALISEPRTVVLYEAPHRLKQTLEALLEALGDRKISLCRELTKLNEQVERTTLSLAVAEYETRTPKGEYVLVIAPPEKRERSLPSNAELAEAVAERVAAGESSKDAVKAVAAKLGISKNLVYRAAMEAKNSAEG